MTISTVSILGLGYIGLPTAAALATHGAVVRGYDIDERHIEAIKRGEIPFVEPDLATAVRGAMATNALTVSTDLESSDAYIIAVPTPLAPDRTADVSYIQTAAKCIAPLLRGGELVILESTSPPGTTRKLCEWLAAERPDLKFPTATSDTADVFVAHCPERVLPGRIMIEMVTNDRVIGGISPACAEKAAILYQVFAQGDLALTDADSAEMAKLAENAYRDVNIAFANELATICDEAEIDVWEVIRMANRHPRVDILNPGPGVGGHCIAVDPWFIAASHPASSTLIKAARGINDSRPGTVAAKVTERAERLINPVIACLGLSFKANVEDVRESPAIDVVISIAKSLPNARVLVVEPHVSQLPDVLSIFANVELVETNDALQEADIVALLVDHRHFRQLRRPALRGKILIDTRGVWA